MKELSPESALPFSSMPSIQTHGRCFQQQLQAAGVAFAEYVPSLTELCLTLMGKMTQKIIGKHSENYFAVRFGGLLYVCVCLIWSCASFRARLTFELMNSCYNWLQM